MKYLFASIGVLLLFVVSASNLQIELTPSVTSSIQRCYSSNVLALEGAAFLHTTLINRSGKSSGCLPRYEEVVIASFPSSYSEKIFTSMKFITGFDGDLCHPEFVMGLASTNSG